MIACRRHRGVSASTRRARKESKGNGDRTEDVLVRAAVPFHPHELLRGQRRGAPCCRRRRRRARAHPAPPRQGRGAPPRHRRRHARRARLQLSGSVGRSVGRPASPSRALAQTVVGAADPSAAAASGSRPGGDGPN